MTLRKKDHGLSLLELVAAMAIFSVLALMGVQLLSQAMSNRETIARSDARLASVSATVAVLRRDLEHALPLADTSGRQPIFAIMQDGLRIAAAAEGRSETVVWRLDPLGKSLVREIETNPEAALYLVDVGAIQIEVFEENRWSDGAVWRGQGPADIPSGLRVTLSLEDLDEVAVVVAR